MDVVDKIRFIGRPLSNHLGFLEGMTHKFLLISGIKDLEALNTNFSIGLPG